MNMEPEIITSIYQNKAYPCIIHHCYVQQYKYIIYTYKLEPIIEKNRYYNNDNLKDNALNGIMEEIQDFYRKLNLRVPEKSDFIPNTVNVGKNIYLKLLPDGLYDVVASNSSTNFNGAIVLADDLKYEKALERGRTILDLCDIK